MLAEDDLWVQSSWCSPTSRASPMPGMQPRSQTSWGCTTCATGAGAFRPPIPLVEIGSVKDWTGCPINSGTRSECNIPPCPSHCSCSPSLYPYVANVKLCGVSARTCLHGLVTMCIILCCKCGIHSLGQTFYLI